MFGLGTLAEARAALAAPIGVLSDAERIDLIRGLEELKCAAEAAQAVITRDFDVSQRAEQSARGVPAERRGIGVAAQVALARRESPHRGQQHLGLARVLPEEMPYTMAAWREGRITEWRAQLLARETACLSLADRQTVDAELASDPRPWATVRSSPPPARSPTGSTRRASWSGVAAPSPIAGSLSARRRT